MVPRIERGVPEVDRRPAQGAVAGAAARSENAVAIGMIGAGFGISERRDRGSCGGLRL